MFVIRRNVVYVGGLADNISEELIHAAFIPFGELKSIQIPRDFQLNKHRGYAFVEFDLEEDASDAVENMDGAELAGKVIRCNLAKAMPKLNAGQAVWNSEEWIQNSMKGEDGGPTTTDRAAELVLVPTRFEEEEEELNGEEAYQRIFSSLSRNQFNL